MWQDGNNISFIVLLLLADVVHTKMWFIKRWWRDLMVVGTSKTRSVTSVGSFTAPLLAGWVVSFAGTLRQREPRLQACWDGRDGRRAPSPPRAETNAGRKKDQLPTHRNSPRSAEPMLTSLSRRNWRSVEVNLLWDGSERLLSEPSRVLGGIKHALGYWYWESCLQWRSSGYNKHEIK